MSWDKVSPTITGGCTVLSKGRFGHPEENRTLSVREAARLQTFPDNFIFNTNFIDRVCQIIGNALPCKFAYHMSKACLDSLKMLKE
ncbi:DNA cytosine methyltransferase [Enterobacter cloacae complex sp. 342H5]